MTKGALKAKAELDSMSRQLDSSIERRYELVIESFKTKAKKKDLGDCYYLILNIPITRPYVHSPSQEGEEREGSSSIESVDVPEATDVRAREEDH